VRNAAADRVSDLFGYAMIWTICAAVLVTLAVGFGGGVADVFTRDNVAIWAMTASPLLPWLLWLRARAAYGAAAKQVTHEATEKPG
jgi:hypothetical protein